MKAFLALLVLIVMAVSPAWADTPVYGGGVSVAYGTMASASSVDLGTTSAGSFIDISGTSTITSFGTAPAGATYYLRFTGSLTLTYNATSMILPGSRSITTEAGDRAVFISLGSGNWLCHEFLKVSGIALGDQKVVTHSASESATAVSMWGHTHLVTGAYTVTLPTAVLGMSATFCSTTAAVMSIDVAATDYWILAGTTLTQGYKISSTGSAGECVHFVATAANYWRTMWMNAAMVDSGS